MYLSGVALVVILSLASLLHAQIIVRDSCSASYKLCAPKGVSNRDVPEIGPGLGRLFRELLYTIDPQGASRQSSNHPKGPARRESPTSICCADGTECLVLQSFLLPYCWDQFTTDFFLPDGSYGTVSNGSYKTAAGDTVNLISGDFQTVDGRAGNIYQNDPADKPDTSSLPMPTPFTSKGTGTAIAASDLGGTVTNSTTTVFSTSIQKGTVSTTTVVVTPTPTGYGYTASMNTTIMTGYTNPGSGVPSLTMTYTSTTITPPITNLAVRVCLLPQWYVVLAMLLFIFNM